MAICWKCLVSGHEIWPATVALTTNDVHNFVGNYVRSVVPRIASQSDRNENELKKVLTSSWSRKLCKSRSRKTLNGHIINMTLLSFVFVYSFGCLVGEKDHQQLTLKCNTLYPTLHGLVELRQQQYLYPNPQWFLCNNHNSPRPRP